ncbi:hypothetical protein BDZ97DRAFT_1819722 [Flammula alnicola]|nr:hypothetical protein BDZ97DRAFT_1819722 [Flammula alnicola]
MKLRSSPFFLFYLFLSVVADGGEFTNDPYLQYRPPFARSLPVQIMLTGVVLTLVALAGVTTLLISLIATIHVVLSATFAESEKWPYMLSYIASTCPRWISIRAPLDGRCREATWLVMNASTSGSFRPAHIRLLGPFFFSLCPLAIVAAIMQLLPISGSTSVNNIASAVRNAWRTDGGTAVFGCAALSFAVISTALNFFRVAAGLMWAVVLWQSFLGWWWWVGAGSVGLRKEARERRKETKMKAQKVWKGVAGAFAPAWPSRRLRTPGTRRRGRLLVLPCPLSQASSLTLTGSISGTTTQSSYYSGALLLPRVVHRWYASLRHAHNAAARVQAAERGGEGGGAGGGGSGGVGVGGGGVGEAEGGGPGVRTAVVGWGWGWHGFGWRRRRWEGGGGGVKEMEKDVERSRSRSRRRGRERGQETDVETGYEMQPRPRRREEDDEDEKDIEDEEGAGDIYVSDAESLSSSREGELDTHKTKTKTSDGQIMIMKSGHSTRTRRSRHYTTHTPRLCLCALRGGHDTEFVWWWGPLRRWRLQDSTVY